MALNRAIAPEAFPISDFEIQKAEKITLDNGVPVYFINAGNQSIASMHLLFRAGRAYEKYQGDAHFCAKLLMEGTSEKSSAELAEAFEQIGASVYTSASFQSLIIELHCLNRFIKESTALVSSMLADATFPEEEFQHISEVSIQGHRINLEKNSYLAGQKFREKLFGEGHPMAYELSEEFINNYQLSYAVNHYNEQVKGSAFEIFLAGKVDEKILEDLNSTLGQIKIEKALPAEPEVSFDALVGSKEYIEKEEAVQTSIRIGKRLFDIKHEDKVPFEVANEILGGYFGSRLMRNIREEKGLTYGIHSSCSFPKKTGYWTIGADVKKDDRELALQEIYKEIQILCDEKVDEGELELVKNYIAGEYIKSINTPVSLMEYAKLKHFHHLTDQHLDQYISEIHAVTADDVQRMAQKYWSDGMVEILVG
ncbi:M16 family metallopeptidase [Sediminitomix flava]|uniref:Putative Zn-dependent peptidase n=1 Tax=Sediminitomix flava TaxID=379075 RepID=A0A315ZCR1_SEDFL|nr:pitrilysin family protein [Sediminitomix flava]PWJ43366.1 putative Zn-dependent peptidase [Sediminitomix flava]